MGPDVGVEFGLGSSRACEVCGKDFEVDFPDCAHCELCQREILNWMGGFANGSVPRRDSLGEAGTWCYLCGEAPDPKTNPWNIEHVYPRSHGGSDLLTNLGLACRKCNSSKGARMITLTVEQESRLSAQQSAFARRYAKLKERFQQAVLQGTSEGVWASCGFDEDGFEPGDIWPEAVADEVVDLIGYAPIPLGPQGFDEAAKQQASDQCQRFGVPVIREYSDRGWFGTAVSEQEATALISAAFNLSNPAGNGTAQV
jgi:hypothetical protein